MTPELSEIVAALPASTPFKPPEVLERQLGQPFELRLGANESMFGTSPKALHALHQTIVTCAWYPDGTYESLRVALALRLRTDVEGIVIGPGIDGLLGHIAWAFMNPGDTAITSRGSYPTFEYAVAGVGGRIERVEYRNDRPDTGGLLDLAKKHWARLVYLANPDNPSGARTPREEVEALQRELPRDCLLVLDEAYFEFSGENYELPNENVIRLRTFSKGYGMAGLRVAYAFGHRNTVGAINRFRMHFEVNRLGAAAAEAALGDVEFLRNMVEEVRRGRDEYGELATSLGLTSLPSHTNFVAIDLGAFERAQAMVIALQEAGVFVRMPWAAPLNRCIRVTVGTPGQRARFAEIFRDLLKRGL